MAAQLDAFASLIADSFAVHQPRAHANGDAAAAPTAAHLKQQQLEHQRQVDQAVSQFKQKMKREKLQLRATQAIAQQKHDRTEQLQTTKRRFPAWRLDHALGDGPSRAWTDAELRHLSTLLLARNDDVCTCDSASKRRKLAADTAARAHPPAASCCFARLVHASRTLQRPLADVEQRVQAWQQHSAPVAAAGPIAAASANVSRWSFHDDRDAPSPLAPEGVPRWSAARIHELMAAVRGVREEMAAQRKQRRQHKSSAAIVPPEPQSEEPRDGASDGEAENAAVYDLSSSRWCRLGASLHPPQTGLDAHAVYFGVISSCGYSVPRDQAAQSPFYFPPKRLYRLQSRFSYQGPFDVDEAQSDHDDEAEEKVDDEEGANTDSSIEVPNVAQPVDTQELRRTIRRLSKRYRR